MSVTWIDPYKLGAVIDATGGTTYDSGGYRYHKFTANGTFTINSAPTGSKIEVLCVAGGGGAGKATTTSTSGAGGAGGLLYMGPTVATAASYSVVVGAGGAAATATSADGASGSNSLFATNTTQTVSPTVVGTSSDGLGSSVGPLDLPTGMQEDDLVIVVAGSNGSAAINDVSGWTTLRSGVRGTTLTTKVFGKYMGATPDTTIVLSGGQTATAAAAYAVRGVAKDVFYSLAVATTGETGDPDPAAAKLDEWGNNNDFDALVLAIGILDDDNVTMTAPSGYSNLVQASSDNTGLTVAIASLAVNNYDGSDADNPPSFGGPGDDEWIAYSFALTGPTSVLSIGGGGGGSAASGVFAGTPGGSAGSTANTAFLSTTGSAISPFSQIYPQGNGTGLINAAASTANVASPGGGGAGAASAASTAGTGTAGGIGLDYSTWATATSSGDSGYYAGGGGGAGRTNGGVAGGTGGGGAGGTNTGTNGTANTGGGGGGTAPTSGTNTPGAGGSGIVIVRYLL